jgi:peptidyl-prolyl cis-trans isomerase SurA
VYLLLWLCNFVKVILMSAPLRFRFLRSSQFFILGCLAITSSLATAARQTLEEILVIVNNDAVTRDDFDQYKKITLRQLGHSKTPLPPKAQLDEQLLDRLINERIQIQAAEQSGIHVEEMQLSRSLQRIAEDSHMTVPQLMQGLERLGISVTRFREEIRREILLNRLQEREIGARVNISDADIDRFWDQQAKTITPGEGTIIPQYHARHILVRVSEAMPDADAHQKINDLYKKVQRNQDQFKTLAEQFSEDGTAKKGGDLGWVGPGDTVPEFEHTLTQLKPNQISLPVRTPFGYHIIQLLETRQYDVLKNRDKAVARNALRGQKMQEAFADWLKELRSKASIEYRSAPAPLAVPTLDKD